ncbi:MAG: metal-dependent hydrolase [Desulfosarcinaceae bacterium]|nr:metal-dependent hydrolase [Desulfosarcinaceae bacterium]
MTLSRRAFFRSALGAAGIGGLGALLGPAEATAAPSAATITPEVKVEWLGHGSFLLESRQGRRILIDPWLSTNPMCPGRYRKNGGFGKVDLILWTHGHVDHFMLTDAKALVSDYAPKIIAPWELNFFIKSEIPEADCGTFTLGNKGSSADIDGIRVTMVEAFHSAGAQLTGFEGTNRFVGEAVGYILEFENGLRVYHAGDTSLMADMKLVIADYYKPDVAILPIGGVFTMGPEEAAYACGMIRPRVVIPEHYGTFPVLEPDCERFRKFIAQHAAEVSVLELTPGQTARI